MELKPRQESVTQAATAAKLAFAECVLHPSIGCLEPQQESADFHAYSCDYNNFHRWFVVTCVLQGGGLLGTSQFCCSGSQSRAAIPILPWPPVNQIDQGHCLTAGTILCESTARGSDVSMCNNPLSQKKSRQCL